MLTGSMVQDRPDAESQEKLMSASEKLLDAAKFQTSDRFAELLASDDGTYIRLLQDNPRLALDVYGALSTRSFSLKDVRHALRTHVARPDFKAHLQDDVLEMRRSLFVDQPCREKWFKPLP